LLVRNDTAMLRGRLRADEFLEPLAVRFTGCDESQALYSHTDPADYEWLEVGRIFHATWLFWYRDYCLVELLELPMLGLNSVCFERADGGSLVGSRIEDCWQNGEGDEV